MIKKAKRFLKNLNGLFWEQFFKRVNKHPLLKHYPKGKNYLFDLLIEEKHNDGFVILDVGAHMGQSALYYTKMLKDPQIFSFEPVKDTYKQLCENVKTHPDIQCLNYALGEENATAEIKLQHWSGTNTLVKEHNATFKTEPSETVEVARLDDVIDDLGIKNIDLLKIDVEGYEMQVLKGAQNLFAEGRIKYVVSEVGFNSLKNKTEFGRVYDFLKGYNFGLCGFYNPYRWGREWTDIYGTNFTYLKWTDALFRQIG